MALDPIEQLKNGHVDFMYDDFFSLDTTKLSSQIRKNEDRLFIIKQVLSLLIKDFPYFCMQLIYDLDEFQSNVFFILEQKDNDLFYFFGIEEFKNILNNTSWGYSFILNNITAILEKYEKFIEPLLDYIFTCYEERKTFVQKLYLHENLHIRAIFMQCLIKNQYEKLSDIYDDILKCVVCFKQNKQEFMSFQDISLLAVCFLRHNDVKNYDRFKEFILKNYKQNDLALHLLDTQVEFEDLFLQDANRLFETSSNFQFYIYANYAHFLSQEIRTKFKNLLAYFYRGKDADYQNLNKIWAYGLSHELEEYIDKYLSLSKRKDWAYVKSGSTCDCYRIGDYVFKLSHKKYSSKNEICPSLYNILKNLEEHYVRNENGNVVAGLEIQKFLTKSMRDLPFNIRKQSLIFLESELQRLGYYYDDRLFNGRCGDNCMLLDTYLDADTDDFESLPLSFKEYPAVIIDRDLIYKLDESFMLKR